MCVSYWRNAAKYYIGISRSLLLNVLVKLTTWPPHPSPPPPSCFWALSPPTQIFAESGNVRGDVTEPPRSVEDRDCTDSGLSLPATETRSAAVMADTEYSHLLYCPSQGQTDRYWWNISSKERTHHTPHVIHEFCERTVSGKRWVNQKFKNYNKKDHLVPHLVTQKLEISVVWD